MEKEVVKCALSIPFSSKEFALLAYEVVNVDKELKGSGIHREITTEGRNICASFIGPDLKKLRVAIGAFLKTIILVTKTLEKFPFLDNA